MAKPTKTLNWLGTNKNNTYNLEQGKFLAGSSLNGSGGFDTLQLASNIVVDFSVGNLVNFEAMLGMSGDEKVSLLATQWAQFQTINLGLGTDTLTVYASGDISALSVPTISNVELGQLSGTARNDTIKLTGQQLDSIIIGNGIINLGGGWDTINLTSTSADLNTLGQTDSMILGVEVIDASTAKSGVLINLSGQSEGFTLYGSSFVDTIFGGNGNDTVVAMGSIVGRPGSEIGDDIYGGFGNDTLWLKFGSAVGTVSRGIGDFLDLYSNSIGGDDEIHYVDESATPHQSVAYLVGDAWAMHGNAQGGRDVLYGGSGTQVVQMGDAHYMYGTSKGGVDVLYGPDNSSGSRLAGDALVMSDYSSGADDKLYGGANSFAELFGDASSMDSFAVGGADFLVAPSGIGSDLYGDAMFANDFARCGNDILVGNTGNDAMWGDARFINSIFASPNSIVGNVITGSDTFVFAPGGGNDRIYDFRQSDNDVIDVSAFSFTQKAYFNVVDDGSKTTLHFDANNSVTLEGFTGVLNYDGNYFY